MVRTGFVETPCTLLARVFLNWLAFMAGKMTQNKHTHLAEAPRMYARHRARPFQTSSATRSQNSRILEHVKTRNCSILHR